MKFEFIKEVDAPVMSYGVMVSTGDVVEFDGWLAEKAKSNPNYRRCDEPIKVDESGEIPVNLDEAAGDESPPDDLDDLRAQWEAKFGKKPHHKKSVNTLREDLNDGD